MNRYALRDDQWERIKHLLPGKAGDVGVTASDNRRFVEAVLYRYRAGIPWRDLPERFGDMQREVLRIWQQTQRRSCSSRTISTRHHHGRPHRCHGAKAKLCV
jgi:transposase